MGKEISKLEQQRALRGGGLARRMTAAPGPSSRVEEKPDSAKSHRDTEVSERDQTSQSNPRVSEHSGQKVPERYQFETEDKTAKYHCDRAALPSATFKEGLCRHKLSLRDYSEMTGTPIQTVKRWSSGASPVTASAMAVLRALDLAPGLKDAMLEDARARGSS